MIMVTQLTRPVVAPSPVAFMARAVKPPNSNTEWGSRYAATLRRIVYEHAANSPRTLQEELGPSEIGHECHRQVVAKLAGIERTNHIVDPWASIVGTALHMWLAEALKGDNDRYSYVRWLAEFRVQPHEDHPGTGDAYDFFEACCLDWKNLGDTTLTELRTKGPARHYYVQLLAYARGFRIMGLPVRRIVIAAMPRTKSTLDNMYVWEHELTPADDALLEQVFQEMRIRKAMAAGVRTGQISLNDITPTPSDSTCYFCPVFRSDVLHDPSATGCAGHHLLPGRLNK